MKATIRLTIGILSSLLLSAGFSRAAVRLDPLSQQLGSANQTASFDDASGGPCVLPCAYQPRPDNTHLQPDASRSQ